MKKPVRLTLVAMLMLAPLFAKDRTFVEIKRMAALTELDASFIKELALGMHPDVAVECKKGTTLPLRFFHNWGLFSLKCAPNLTVKVEEPCYLRCVRKKLYISQDLVTWEKADKFFNGKCDANVNIDEQSGILVESQQVPYSENDSDEAE